MRKRLGTQAGYPPDGYTIIFIPIVKGYAYQGRGAAWLGPQRSLYQEAVKDCENHCNK